MSLRALRRSVIIMLALTACGKTDTLPTQPQLVLDREAVEFGSEWTGTKPQESLIIQNGGLNDLTITEVSLSGDSAFTASAPTETTLKGKGRAFVQLIFAPTAVKSYSAKLKIVSNAENASEKVLDVTGKGVKPGTDGG